MTVTDISKVDSVDVNLETKPIPADQIRFYLNDRGYLSEKYSEFQEIPLHPAQATQAATTQRNQPDASAVSQSGKSTFLLLCKKHLNITVNVPLIPLKLALFLWFGGGSAFQTFLQVYYRKLGISVSEISVVYIISPLVQFFGSALSGAIADKLGRSKPVLVANVALVVIFANSILLLPKIKPLDCKNVNIHANCPGEQTNANGYALCSLLSNEPFYIDIESCQIQNVIEKRNFSDQENVNISNGSLCQFQKEYFSNKSFLFQIANFSSADECNHDTNYFLFPNNSNINSCTNHTEEETQKCNLMCSLATETENCSESNSGRFKILVIFSVINILFTISYSNVYRFMDVTSMSMVKTYNSDFGRERLWSILGVVGTVPFVGYLIQATSPGNMPKNYAVAFYFFDGLVVLFAMTVWKLDVPVNPKGEKMWKKTVSLLKNIDVLFFAFTVFVLGTAWGFTKIYSIWHLDKLQAPSMLIGLIPAMNSILGLPFLFTSSWFLQTIGSTNLLILGLISHTVYCIGYSFLVNPWWALIYESASIFTYHLLWVAVICHSNDVAPQGLKATVLSTAGAIHYGIGKGSGSLIGGLIMGEYGGRRAYRVMASICVTYALIYGSFLYLRKRYLRKKSSNDAAHHDKNSSSKTVLDKKESTVHTVNLEKINKR